MLSIIVPALDEGAGIADHLASLQPLRQAGHEVIVVDGGSRDETVERAQPWADQVLIAPRGRGRQMNAGALIAGGEILLFLHADTRLPAAADQQITRGLATSGCRWGRFDVRLDGRHPLLRAVERLMNVRSRLSGIATGDQALFVRREVFQQVGGFADIPLMEDIALSKALKAQGPPLCLNTPVVTSSRRWEQRGVLRTVMLMWRLRLAYWWGADPHRLAQRYGRA